MSTSAHKIGDERSSLGRALRWLCRLSSIPWLAGWTLLDFTRGVRSPRPAVIAFLLCFLGASMGLVGLFGLVRAQEQGPDKKLPWTVPILIFAVIGILGSFVIAAASVAALSGIEVED